jgi:hypothetical protein
MTLSEVLCLLNQIILLPDPIMTLQDQDIIATQQVLKEDNKMEGLQIIFLIIGNKLVLIMQKVNNSNSLKAIFMDIDKLEMDVKKNGQKLKKNI